MSSKPVRKPDFTTTNFELEDDKTRVDRTNVVSKSTLEDAFDARTVVAPRARNSDHTESGVQEPTKVPKSSPKPTASPSRAPEHTSTHTPIHQFVAAPAQSERSVVINKDDVDVEALPFWKNKRFQIGAAVVFVLLAFAHMLKSSDDVSINEPNPFQSQLSARPIERQRAVESAPAAPAPAPRPVGSQAVLDQFEQSFTKTQGQNRPDPSRY